MLPLCERLLKLDAEARSLYYHLAVIRQDHELIGRGWKLSFATDFHEVHGYAVPSERQWLQVTSGSSISAEARQRLVGNQAARRFIFQSLKDIEYLVLLPPFAVELRNEILRYRAGLEKLDAEVLAQRYFRDILDSQETDTVNEAIKYRLDFPEGDLPLYLATAVLKIVQNKFHDLLLPVFAPTKHGLQRIQALLSKRPRQNARLTTLDLCWNEAQDIAKSVTVETVLESPWFRMLQAVRDRWLSNYRDAYALELLQAINSKLQLMDPPRLLLIVSGAPTMEIVANWDLFAASSTDKYAARIVELTKHGSLVPKKLVSTIEGSREVRLLRTPQTFLYYLMSLNEGEEGQLDQLKKYEDQATKFVKTSTPLAERIREVCPFLTDEGVAQSATPCEHCGLHLEVESVIEKELRSTERLLSQITNIQLCKSRKYFIDAQQDIADDSLDRAATDLTYAFLDMLDGRVENIGSLLDAQRKELDTLLSAAQSRFRAKVFEDDELVKSWGAPYKLQVLMHIRHRLTFRNPEIVVALEDLLNSQKKSWVSRRTSMALSRIYELTDSRDDVYNESALLLAAVLYAFGGFLISRAICARHISELLGQEMEAAKLFDYRYLHCLSNNMVGFLAREKDTLEKSICDARDLVQDFPEDARAYHLLGICCLRAFQRDLLPARQAGDIRESFTKANELCHESAKDLRMAILNNIAYAVFSTADKTKDSVAAAVAALGSLKRIAPKTRDWPVTYLDTLACIKFMESEITSDPDQKLELLGDAKGISKEAIEKAIKQNAPERELNRLKDHLRLITDGLRRK